MILNTLAVIITCFHYLFCMYCSRGEGGEERFDWGWFICQCEPDGRSNKWKFLASRGVGDQGSADVLSNKIPSLAAVDLHWFISILGKLNDLLDVYFIFPSQLTRCQISSHGNCHKDRCWWSMVMLSILSLKMFVKLAAGQQMEIPS